MDIDALLPRSLQLQCSLVTSSCMPADWIGTTGDWSLYTAGPELDWTTWTHGLRFLTAPNGSEHCAGLFCTQVGPGWRQRLKLAKAATCADSRKLEARDSKVHTWLGVDLLFFAGKKFNLKLWCFCNVTTILNERKHLKMIIRSAPDSFSSRQNQVTGPLRFTLHNISRLILP